MRTQLQYQIERELLQIFLEANWQCAAVSVCLWSIYYTSFPCGSAVKNPPANAGDPGDTSSVPRWGRSPGGGHGYPLQYSCLGNPMDRGAWRAAICGVAESDTAEQSRSATHQMLYVHCLDSLKARSIAPVFRSWDSGCVTCSAPCSQSGSLTDPPGLGPELAHHVCYDTGPTKVHAPKPRVSPEGRP